MKIKRFEKKRHFICPVCETKITLTFWQWFRAIRLDKNWYGVYCPECDKSYWMHFINKDVLGGR